MTSKELKRLSRSDLLEMLLELSKENEQLRVQNNELKKQLEDRNITIANCGSLAEASLQLNGVFQAAQTACEQYLQNIQSRSQNIEQYCKKLEQETQKKCNDMVNDAKLLIRMYTEDAQKEYGKDMIPDLLQ